MFYLLLPWLTKDLPISSSSIKNFHRLPLSTIPLHTSLLLGRLGPMNVSRLVPLLTSLLLGSMNVPRLFPLHTSLLLGPMNDPRLVLILQHILGDVRVLSYQ